ncbi:MAG: hypothetical protein ISR65_10540 [Bacteriovoracaceae bacterium]|nr:hypothetical protein [Bacteriovoracaceae bacterium]
MTLTFVQTLIFISFIVVPTNALANKLKGQLLGVPGLSDRNQVKLRQSRFKLDKKAPAGDAEVVGSDYTFQKIKHKHCEELIGQNYLESILFTADSWSKDSRFYYCKYENLPHSLNHIVKIPKKECPSGTLLIFSAGIAPCPNCGAPYKIRVFSFNKFDPELKKHHIDPLIKRTPENFDGEFTVYSDAKYPTIKCLRLKRIKRKH